MYLSHLFFAAPTYDEAAKPSADTAVYGSEDQIAEVMHVSGPAVLGPARIGDSPLLHLGRPVLCQVLALPRTGLPKAVASVWVRAEAYPTLLRHQPTA